MRSVLVVDDEESLRALLSRHLARAGFETLHAEDGIEALAVLRNTLPQAIVTDLQMPRMSGIEFIGVVRQRFPSIPVIVLSATIPRELPEDVKPNHWIQKSADAFSELVRTVHEMAQKPPDDFPLPQVIPVPVRAVPSLADSIIVTCTDCLRTFRAERPPGDQAGIAICTHCDAQIPFRIEG